MIGLLTLYFCCFVICLFDYILFHGFFALFCKIFIFISCQAHYLAMHADLEEH